MKSALVSSPAQSRLIKQKFTNPEEQLSYELGKAVQELPPLYTRLLAGSISLLVFGTIAWANFSEVEEVAVAPGELIPSAEVRPVSSLNEGNIISIKVKEGQRIKKDETLLELDPSVPKASVENLEKSAQLIQDELARLEAERTGNSSAGTVLQNQLLAARLQEFDLKRSSALAEAERQKATRQEAEVRLARLQENLMNAKTNLDNAKTNFANAKTKLFHAEERLAKAIERETMLSPLVAESAVPRIDYNEAQDRHIQADAEVTKAQDEITNAQDNIIKAQDNVTSLEKEVEGQQQKISQAQQAYQAARDEAERLDSERQSEILGQLHQRREDLTTAEGKLEQASKDLEQKNIKAPVSGTIYSIKATNGPVQVGEELLSILPDNEQLVLEVKVLNRDIGFISKGMKSKVKLSTFPFQEFGSIEGTVVHVSPNAIVDEDLGLVFPTRIQLEKHSIKVRYQDVELAPGMAGTGEIVLRKKSILTFLIEPITRRTMEAFSVR